MIFLKSPVKMKKQFSMLPYLLLNVCACGVVACCACSCTSAAALCYAAIWRTDFSAFIRVCFLLGKWASGERKCQWKKLLSDVGLWKEINEWLVIWGRERDVTGWFWEREARYLKLIAWAGGGKQLEWIQTSSAFFGKHNIFKHVLGKELRICNNRNGKSEN